LCGIPVGELVFTVVVAVLAFAATHLDDLLVLTGSLAAGRVTSRDALRGQVIGTGALMVVSCAAALGTILIPPGWHHWLGLLPLGVGLRHLYVSATSWLKERKRNKHPHAAKSAPPSVVPPRSGILVVALLALANGGDNLAVYTALFNAQTFLMSGVTILVGMAMAAVWAAFASALAHHPVLGIPIRKVGPWLLPWVLVGLGVLILLPDR
jgi:cadmium resistance protein CadD (predicted permease)